jgi:ribonuclease BN (tRNA processing enzyme)
MQIRVLGAYQCESRHSHSSSYLIDDSLALDAGGLTSSLSLEEQSKIRAVLLTHCHFDHIKDLAPLGFNLFDRSQLTIVCTDETRASIEDTILNEKVWLNFFRRPCPSNPTFVHLAVQPGRPFRLLDYQMHPVLVNHTVQTVGYEITAPSGARLFYTGDNGPGSSNSWVTPAPDLLITEATFPDSLSHLAIKYGHLSTSLLAKELEAYQKRCGVLPRILVVHTDLHYAPQIANEIDEIASSLNIQMRLAREGERVALAPKSSSPPNSC